MIREFIDQAIKSDSCITITYSKDGKTKSLFHLKHISYSPQYGDNYIVGFCYESDSELTFKVDRIANAEDEWIDVTNDNPYRPNCMQLLVYLADSYYGYALKHCKQCEWTSQLMKVLQQNDVYAIHYIPYLDKYSIGKRIAYKNDNKILHAGIYTFAYRILDTKKREENEIIDYEWKKMGHNAIYYKAVSITSTKTIDMLIFPKNLEIMAYHYSPYYHDLLGFT